MEMSECEWNLEVMIGSVRMCYVSQSFRQLYHTGLPEHTSNFGQKVHPLSYKTNKT